MKVSTTEARAALNAIAPALSNKDLLEELCCAWFDGERVSAFNDVIGMEFAFPADFRGGVRGSLLLGLLNNAKTEDVEFKSGGNPETGIVYKAGKAKADLALLGTERRIWTHDDAQPTVTVKLTEAMLACFKSILLSAGTNTSVPDQLGVTIIRNEGADAQYGALDFYTTDRATISWNVCDAPEGWPPGRIAAPVQFVEQLLKLAKPDDELDCYADRLVLVTADDTILMGRLLSIDQPLAFGDAVAKSVPADMNLFPVPPGMRDAVLRSKVVLGTSSDKKITVTLSAGKMILLTKNLKYGELRDELDAPGNTTDLSLNVNVDLLARGVENASEIAASKDCIVTTASSGLIHLIAAMP